MLNKQKGSKGFTLVELSISLGVAVIVLAMLSLSIYYLHNAFTTSENVSISLNEYSSIKEKIESTTERWVKGSKEVRIQQNALACISGEDVEELLFFKDGNLFLNNNSIFNTCNISAISFNLFNDDIVATVVFTNDELLKFII